MKGIKAYTAAFAALLALTACGNTNGGSSQKEKAKPAEMSVSVSEYSETKEISDQIDSDGEPNQTAESKTEGNKKAAHKEIGFNGADAVSDVLLIPYTDIDISRKVSFSDVYGLNVMHSGVVGLVGAPVDVRFDYEEVGDCKLVFVYDPEKLYGVRPDALMFMYSDDEGNEYTELEDGVLNTENCSMSVEITRPGVYMLVNKYEWLNCWGANLSDNGMEPDYDPSQRPISSAKWEKNESTGDILDLKDDEYIKSCRQETGDYVFHVSTPEELASAVFVNNCAEPRPNITIELANDIDLDGYEWAPMGWYTAGVDFDFTGAVYGNGYTIKNMHISNGYHVGFIGFGTDAIVVDLHFENAYVGGRDVGILAGYPRNMMIYDCSVQGIVEGSDAGTLIGCDQSNDIQNCTADVTLNGEKTDNYLSYSDIETAKLMETVPASETIWLDDEDRPSREPGLEDNYRNLCWNISHNGKTVLKRAADNETSLEWHMFEDIFGDPGEYEVYLYAVVNSPDGLSGYAPVSNTVTFTVDENTEFIPYSNKQIYEGR